MILNENKDLCFFWFFDINIFSFEIFYNVYALQNYYELVKVTSYLKRMTKLFLCSINTMKHFNAQNYFLIE